MRIRQERPGDEAGISAVHAAAFRFFEDPDAVPVEVLLIEELRASGAWLHRLSIVAEADGRIVGHVMCTRAHIEEVPVLGLGPIGVEPSMQDRGIGRSLMEAVIAEADAMREPLIGLLGSRSYYSKFGFVPAADLGITAPDPNWGDNFQTQSLASYRPDIRDPSSTPSLSCASSRRTPR